MSTTLIPVKEYIGDSVYVDFDGFSFVLTTENGRGPSNTIVLEPNVYEALVQYVGRVEEFIKATNLSQ